jgi:hypothetical protein
MARGNISRGMSCPQAAHKFHLAGSHTPHCTRIPKVLIEHGVISILEMWHAHTIALAAIPSHSSSSTDGVCIQWSSRVMSALLIP